MKYIMALVLFLMTAPVHAASLLWDAQPTVGALTIERGPTATGPFSTVVTVPEGTTAFILTPGAFDFYRVRNPSVTSNVVQFSLDLYTGGLEDRVTALEAALLTLSVTPSGLGAVQTPLPAQSNLLTTRQIDSTRVELTCVGTSMKTTGTGLKRIVECLP